MGRTRPGVAFFLYPEAFLAHRGKTSGGAGPGLFDAMQQFSQSEIERLPPDINGQVPPQIIKEGLLVILRPRDLAR